MNTYNENLRSAIVTSLQSQDLEQKNLDSKLTASMFTLYHAEGATITAHEKLDNAQDDLTYKSNVKALAVANSNVANNELTSATQASDLMKQSMSNTAVCAANVQIAANAVVKLASDMGSIYSIINAADYGSDIYIQAEDARNKMNETAYDAEYASQLAMEASMMVSEVSSSTMLDQSKTTNGLMNNVLKIASDDFNAASGIVAGDNSALAEANTNEKVAEGTYKYLSVDYNAAKEAYKSLNNELNLGLAVTVPDTSDVSFTVQFRTLAKPFADAPNPVANYYVFIAEESQGSVFSLSNAENLLNKGLPLFVKMELPEKNADNIKPVNSVDGVNISLKNNVVSVTVNFPKTTANANPLIDTTEMVIDQGQNYVAFVMAVYTDEYKRKINNFSDYLSAPSLSFSVSYNLKAAQRVTTIPIDPANPAKDDVENQAAFQSQPGNPVLYSADSDDTAGKNYNYRINFTSDENPEFPVEYRCMLLPTGKGFITPGMLTEDSFESFLQEITSLEKISNEYDPKIAEAQAQLYQFEMQDQQAALNKDGGAQKELTQKSDKLSQTLSNLMSQKENLIEKLGKEKRNKLQFFFNADLAEQVPAGCYIKAVPDTKPDAKKQAGRTNWVAYIEPGTTDNFGNLLMEGQTYLPIVLSAATAAEENLSKFTNTLSDTGDAFEYNEKFTNPAKTDK